MARITSAGIDEAVMALKRKQTETGQYFKEALEGACEVAQAAVAKQIQAFDVIDKGTLLKAVKGEIKGYSAEIYPQKKRTDEKHRKGERNETIAFVNEHGRKHKYYMAAKFNHSGRYLYDVKRRSTTQSAANAYAGRPFMQTAYEQGAEEIEQAILDKLGAALNE